jgi:hypothetical protein
MNPTWSSRVAVPDCPLIGRVSFVWKVGQASTRTVFFRVSFPIPSPFIDDWAVYRAHEVRVVTGLATDPVLQKRIIASMRPKIPKVGAGLSGRSF